MFLKLNFKYAHQNSAKFAHKQKSFIFKMRFDSFKYRNTLMLWQHVVSVLVFSNAKALTLALMLFQCCAEMFCMLPLFRAFLPRIFQETISIHNFSTKIWWKSKLNGKKIFWFQRPFLPGVYMLKRQRPWKTEKK